MSANVLNLVMSNTLLFGKESIILTKKLQIKGAPQIKEGPNSRILLDKVDNILGKGENISY